MARTGESWFGIAAIAMIAALVISGAAPTAAHHDGSAAVDAGVPDEYALSIPQEPGVATVADRQFHSVQAAVNAAEPGATITLSGRFEEHVVVDTANVTLRSSQDGYAVIDGGGEGDVLTLNGPNSTVRRVWVRNSGYDAGGNDAGIWVNATGAKILDSRVTAITFGVWIDGVNRVTVANTTIIGREEVTPLSYRGNGIQLWKTEHSVVRNNRITDVRDGLYYSWASEVLGEGNTMWDLRYGVHYMYSDDCRLVGNLAFDNDVGYALMVSKRLQLVNNTAVDNAGTSGHGILLKSVDDSRVVGNELVANDRGLYLYNSLNNSLVGNLVLENDMGVYLAAGSVDGRVVGNSFIHNRLPVHAVIGEQVSWNGTDRGNYWSGARRADIDHDGIGEVRYRPAGLVEHLVATNPRTAVFAESPAFDILRLAESTFPIIESPGVIDHHPLDRPVHDHWRRYYERD